MNEISQFDVVGMDVKTTSISKQRLYLISKRIFDIIFSFIGCLFLIPIMIFVKISYLLSGDTNSIFYKQQRIGKGGKKIYIYKFRSMVSNAEELLKELLKDPIYNKQWMENQKLDNDPRITKVGNILRKTSLDEVPQFINVLKGDMSLIGPRPLIEGELDEHGGNHLIYESVRPGITGWWACNGRSATTYEERLNLEYYYVKNVSFKLDLKCIYKTVVSVLKRTGAK